MHVLVYTHKCIFEWFLNSTLISKLQSPATKNITDTIVDNTSGIEGRDTVYLESWKHLDCP